MLVLIERIVPNYELAPNLEQVEILRVVVRENTSEAVRNYYFIVTLHVLYLMADALP